MYQNNLLHKYELEKKTAHCKLPRIVLTPNNSYWFDLVQFFLHKNDFRFVLKLKKKISHHCPIYLLLLLTMLLLTNIKDFTTHDKTWIIRIFFTYFIIIHIDFFASEQIMIPKSFVWRILDPIQGSVPSLIRLGGLGCLCDCSFQIIIMNKKRSFFFFC